MLDSDMLSEAHRLTELGFIVHPLTGPNAGGNSPGKRPIKKDWQKQTTPYNEKVMAGWWGPDAKTQYNMGLVCGRASGVMVVDMDSMLFIGDLIDGIELNTLKSARIKTRGHVFFKYDPSIRSQKHHELGIEILSDGSNAVLPPSCHIDGDVYHWADPDDPIQEIPNELKKRLLALFELTKRVTGLIRKCRPCFKRVWKDKDDLHGSDGREMMLAFCTELKANGATLEDIRFVAKIVYQDEYDQGRTDEEFRNSDESKPWKCVTIQDKLSGFVSDEQCDKCGMGRTRYEPSGREQHENSTENNEHDPEKSCDLCRFYRSWTNDNLEESAKCLMEDRWLNPYRLTTCQKWEPKKEKMKSKSKEPAGKTSGKTAIELLTHKHDVPEVVALIEEIEQVEKVKPLILGNDYTYKFYLRSRVLVIPSKHMMTWGLFSRRCFEEFDEKPPHELSKVKIWDLFLRGIKEESLIEIVDQDTEDDYAYDALTFLNELRSYKVVNNTDEYKMKKNILVKQGKHYYLPAGNVKTIKEKLNLKIPHKTLIELISIRYKCGDKSVRVAGESTQCWELCNTVISDDILSITGNRYEEA